VFSRFSRLAAALASNQGGDAGFPRSTALLLIGRIQRSQRRIILPSQDLQTRRPSALLPQWIRRYGN
jgi:hypothetical protein